MRKPAKGTLWAAFADGIPDPRHDRGKRHSAESILFIAAVAAVCGIKTFEVTARWANENEEWFSTLIDLPHGVPCQDTFERFFAALDADIFGRIFTRWVNNWASAENTQVALDGKCIRRSLDASRGQLPIYMVSAYGVEDGIVFGQVKAEEKSNEIAALPKLIESLKLEGALVTIDAAGCQKAIVAQITEEKAADYLISLKGNQGTMHSEVKSFFEAAHAVGFRDVAHDYFEQADKGHGRIEVRKCWVTNDTAWFEDRHLWANLQTFGTVVSRRTIRGKTTSETRYFICSRADITAEEFLAATRKHWALENKLHWMLDVVEGEDNARMRSGNSADNMAILRRAVLSVLEHERKQNPKDTMTFLHVRAMSKPEFRLKVLFGSPPETS